MLDSHFRRKGAREERNSKNGSQEFDVQSVRGRDDTNDFRKAEIDSPSELDGENREAHVQFQVPTVPVIFVLGGPGSGKVTHCDNLTQEKRGVVHINMTDLLHQYSVGDAEGTNDFSRLMSKTVTEVLMLEMKMAPAAKTYLVSGYPRNMRDLVEYSNKINGERNPTEVFADFRSAVLKIIGKQSTAQTSHDKTMKINAADREPSVNPPRTQRTTVSVYNSPNKETNSNKSNRIPPVIWIVGGPGSNKYNLCQKAMQKAQGWVHISVGHLLRSMIESSDGPQVPDIPLIKSFLQKGELVPTDLVMKLVDREMKNQSYAKGIVLDGFPRNLTQLEEFQKMLARCRLDDTVAAFRKRLEFFREHTLPLLKHLDDDQRMNIVDGDTDTKEVQDIFTEILLKRIREALDPSQGQDHPRTRIGGDSNPGPKKNLEIHLADVHDEFGRAVTPLPDSPNLEAPVAAQKTQMNGYGPPRDARTRASSNAPAAGGARDRQTDRFGVPR